MHDGVACLLSHDTVTDTIYLSLPLLDDCCLLQNALAGELKSGQRPTAAQLRQDAEKGLLPLLQTAEAKVAAQKGKDLDGNPAAGKRLKQAKGRAAGKKRKGEDGDVDAPAGGSKQQRKKQQLQQKQRAGGSSRQKRKQQESEEEAATSSSEGGSSEGGEFEGSASDGDEDMEPELAAAAAADGLTGGRGRRAGAGTTHKYAEYES
jgi:hypothetical protein